MSVDPLTKSDIQSAFRRAEELLSCGIFDRGRYENPLIQSAFIELLIRLRDVMYKTETLASRISFDDDVIKTTQVNDVTDLIKFVRDALCHPESESHFVVPDKIKAAFLVAYGKANLAQFGSIVLKSDYMDDVCFFFGVQKIYLKRHIMRALEEARKKLSPILQ
jgi:hypothetical protein